MRYSDTITTTMTQYKVKTKQQSTGKIPIHANIDEDYVAFELLLPIPH
jgi:hypothetical protein